jgi:ABC-type multidrug transport system ATPase subunit
MLDIRDLSKTYANGVQALKNVSLQIPTGMFGLLGPNGAGKSSLMRTIATLQDPDRGTIQLDGLDVLANKPAARRLLGYLPQEFGLYPRFRSALITTVRFSCRPTPRRGISSRICGRRRGRSGRP